MEQQNLLLSPLTKRGRVNNSDVSDIKDELASNKSSPGKIQSSQKEIDEFFENFQQQIQVRFLNFDENVQECDLQVKKCLNKIFETEVVKEKKQIQTFSARPPSSQKKNKIIFLNPFESNDNNYPQIDDQSTKVEKNSEQYAQNIQRQSIKTSNFLEINNMNNQNQVSHYSKQNYNEGQTNKTNSIFPNIQNKIRTYNVDIPIINASGFNSRFRAHSINDSVSDNLHKQFVQQRNNCNQGDSIFTIRDHKFERQRILSNETRYNKNNLNQQQTGIIKHPYLNQINNKAIEQNMQQQNFLQSLRNAFRVTFNNPNQTQQNENVKNSLKGNEQEVKEKQNMEISFKEYKAFDSQEGFMTTNQSQTPLALTNNNNNNNNVKVFKRKDRNFKPTQIENNKPKLNNNSFEIKTLKIEQDTLNNLSPTQIETSDQISQKCNQKDQKLYKNEAKTENSQYLIRQIQELNMNKYIDQYQNNCLDTLTDALDLSQKAAIQVADTKIAQRSQTNIQNKYRNIQTQNTQINEESSLFEYKENAVSDKPKKKVIKISKESVFCKIIQEQKEKKFSKKDSTTQIMIATKQRVEPALKQMSQDFQETKFPQFNNNSSNNNFQIYQDQNLLQKYQDENGNLQQKVKMFKFNKKVSNKTENAVEKDEQQNILNIELVLDKENISENILNNILQVESSNQNQKKPQQDDQKLSRVFSRNKTFHHKNRSLNEANNMQSQQSNLEIGDTKLNNEFKYDIQVSQVYSPSVLSKKVNQQNQLENENKKYDIDEIKNSIFLKKSISSFNTGNTYFKNQLNQQTTQNDQQTQNFNNLQKNRQTFKSLYNPSNSNQQVYQQITTLRNDNYLDSEPNQTLKDQALNLKNKQTANVNPYEPSFCYGNKKNTFQQNNSSKKALNGSKKFFGINSQIENMFIQNIDEFKEKFAINQ
ncbi:hypothetical protein ABPG74_012660 [Tetrahymena malaccensis]